jgi:hypothetical protein
MGSTTWNQQENAMATGPDDDFQQFLDMSGMGNLTDGLQFDFPSLPDAAGQNLLQHGPQGSVDTPMGGTDQTMMLASNNNVNRNPMPAMTSAAAMASIPAQMIPPPTPTEAIVEIDAQIQYLQQQRLQQQQRHIHEQQAAYFANHTQAVPPTPQSMELPPNSCQFYPAEQPNNNQHPIFDGRYQRINEQQDVSLSLSLFHGLTCIKPIANR